MMAEALPDTQQILQWRKQRCELWMWVMVGLALLFNPIVPLSFSVGEWIWIDYFAGSLFFLSMGFPVWDWLKKVYSGG
jgi:hypothetical protein